MFDPQVSSSRHTAGAARAMALVLLLACGMAQAEEDPKLDSKAQNTETETP